MNCGKEVKMDTSSLLSKHAENIIDCGRSCLKNECESFDYYHSTGSCVEYKFRTNGTCNGLMQASGWQHHEIVSYILISSITLSL